MGVRKDITGQSFNYLTAIRFLRIDERRTIWLFRCLCGNFVESTLSSVKIGNRKSCGCLKRRKSITFLTGRNRKAYGESCKRSLYLRYKANARGRDLEFKLTYDQFATLTSQNCAYCGQEPNSKATVSWNRDVHPYNGIDRVDNSKGYTLENSVACCINCNRAKHALSQSEFFDLVKRICTHSRLL